MSQGFNAQCIPFQFDVASATFTEKEILLPQSRGGLMPGIIQIDIEYDESTILVDDKSIGWHVSVSSETSLKHKDNQNVIESEEHRLVYGAAAIEENMVKTQDRVPLPAPVIVTREKVYIGVYHDTGVSQSIRGRIWYVPRNAPGIVQRQNLVNQTQY